MEQEKIEDIDGTGTCRKLFTTEELVVAYSLEVYRVKSAVPTQDEPDRAMYGRRSIIGKIVPICFVDSEVVLQLNKDRYARLLVQPNGRVQGGFSDSNGQ
jgi:hypothetical protein